MSLARPFTRHPQRIVGEALALLQNERLRQDLRDIAARLAELEGWDVQPQNGRQIERMTLGDAYVLVEFECEPADGDGWNEPRIEASVTPIQVFINGAWCDVLDVAPGVIADAWAVEVQQRWDDEADAAKADAQAEAREFA